MSSHYYDWKPIGVEAAQRALDKGGKLLVLPSSFFSGGATYRTGLQTKRGTCYLVSDMVKQGLKVREESE